MGGGSWSDDVPVATHKTSSGFKFSDEAVKEISRTSADPKMLMVKRRIIVVKQKDPVGIIVDGSGSMGKWAYTIRDKSMMYTGQVRSQHYLDDPGFNLSVIGDANAHDEVPIQMSEFVSDNQSFKSLTKELYYEGGGGEAYRESYELGMYGYARRVELAPDSRKGFLFILGDEAYYEVIKAQHLSKYFGEAQASSIQTSDIIAELKEKYHFFKLHINAGCYDAETDQKVQRQWREAMGQHYIYLSDPNAVIDTILGCIAMTTGTRDIDSYVNEDMVERKQENARRIMVRETLKEIDFQL